MKNNDWLNFLKKKINLIKVKSFVFSIIIIINIEFLYIYKYKKPKPNITFLLIQKILK